MFHTSFVNNYNEAQKKKGKERVKKNIMIDPQHHTFSVKLQHANVEKKIEEFIPSVTLIKKSSTSAQSVESLSCFHKIVRIKNSDIQIYGCDLVVKTITDAETKLMLPFSCNY